MNGSNDKYKEGKGGEEEAIALTTADTNARECVNNDSEKTVIDAEDELHDGCIILGENADKGVRYVLIPTEAAVIPMPTFRDPNKEISQDRLRDDHIVRLRLRFFNCNKWVAWDSTEGSDHMVRL